MSSGRNSSKDSESPERDPESPHFIIKIDHTKRIAKGGFSVIRPGTLSHPDGYDIDIAVKMFVQDINGDVLFENEIKMIDILTPENLPHITTFFGYKRYTEVNLKFQNIIMMEHAPYGSLERHLEVLSQHPTLSYIVFEGATKGLEALHALGIVHRDVKAENLLVTGNWKVRWCDFGLSQTLPLTKEDYVGTPLWMAPEMLQNQKIKKGSEPEVLKDQERSKALDMYGLGIVFLSVLLGKAPGADIKDEEQLLALVTTERRADIPVSRHRKKRTQMVEWLTAFNPLDRPSASELLTQIKNTSQKLIDEKEFRKFRLTKKLKLKMRTIAEALLSLNQMIREHLLIIKNNRVGENFDITLPEPLAFNLKQIKPISSLANLLTQIFQHSLLDVEGAFGTCLHAILWLKHHESELHQLFSKEHHQRLLLLLKEADKVILSMKNIKRLESFIQHPRNQPTFQFVLPLSFLQALSDSVVIANRLRTTFQSISEREEDIQAPGLLGMFGHSKHHKQHHAPNLSPHGPSR
jgi:serine/threonine protein kinase